MQGTLTTVCLPDLLRTIYIGRRTGQLILKQGNIKKQIYFELGQVVFAASNQQEDKLGETLVRHGKLSREELENLLPTLGRARHLGKTLVENGVLTDRELITYVTFQLIDIIYSLFTWTFGDYEFAEGDYNRAPEELKLKFSTATIILEGVRRIEDFEIIRRGLGDLNRLIVPTPSPLLRLQSLALKPLERYLLDLVTEPMDILRILIYARELPNKSLQALYGLLSVGLLEQGATPELSTTTGRFVVPDSAQEQAEVAPPVQYLIPPATWAAPSVPRPTVNTETTEANKVQNEISTMRSLLATQDPYLILGVTPQSSPQEIRDAYYFLAAKFHPDKFIQSPRHIRADVEAIFAKISESFNKLRASIASATAKAPTHNSGSHSSYYLTPKVPYAGAQPSAPSAYTNPAWQGSQPPNPSRTQPEAEEIVYPGFDYHKMPKRGSTGGVEMESALNDLIEFLEDKRAPLFVADSLSLLFRTKPPITVDRIRVIETVVTWARQKSSWTGSPLTEVLLNALSSIKHAEQARVLKDFEPTTFYPAFIRELATYCPPNEAQNFVVRAGGL
ncbi:MAG: DUF4388 domain-containing protein [Blastocatellia bacterium]|nr:DUF4388 domain-containing protein [Blastocatellia bacterium]